MKKINKLLFMLSFAFLFCFIGMNKTNALEVGISFDDVEQFNFFYEQKHNTEFYQYLIKNGNNLVTDLQDISSLDSSYKYIYIAYIDQLLVNIRNNITIENKDSIKYIIILSDRPLNYYYEDGEFVTKLYQLDGEAVFFYDSAGSYLGYQKLTYGTYVELSRATNTSYQYILSTYWYSNSNVNTMYYTSFPSKINVAAWEIDNKTYSFMDYEVGWFGYEFFYNFSAWFTGADKEDSDYYGLEYFRVNYIFHKSKNITHLGLYQMMTYDLTSEYTVPDGYSNVSFTRDEPYYLIPNSLTCSVGDSYVYLTSSNANSLTVVTYSLLENDVVSDSIIGQYFLEMKKANTVYAMNLNKIIATDTLLTDNIYLFSSQDNIAENNLYYNPNCYDAFLAGSESITFVNVNTGNDVDFSKSQQNMQINDSNTYADDVEENSVMDIASLAKTTWEAALAFILAGYEIVILSTTLFSLLPEEIAAIILLAFIVAVLTMLISFIASIVSKLP